MTKVATIVALALMFLFGLASLVLFTSVTHGLEKVSAPADLERPGAWDTSITCSLVYYNTCTGWVWIWSGWEQEAQLGVQFDTQACTGSPAGFLISNRAYVWTGSPHGRGFTGTIAVYDAGPNDCPVGPSLATQVFLPFSGWNTYLWGVAVGSSFVVQATHGDSGLPDPTSYPTDHPAAGPTGPQACGVCYPTTRAAHSYLYGTATSPLCPGSPLDDGVCTAEFLWEVSLANAPLSIDDSTWGTIKGLYR